MKTFILSLTFAIGISSGQAQYKSLEKLWETPDLPTPESVLFHKNSLFVSLIDGNGSEKDNKGGIALLNTDGSVKNKSWITGLDAPKGMALHKNILYVADITAIVLIDVKKSQVIRTIEVDGAQFLNDIAVDKSGVVYISDTRENKIYQLKDGQVSLFLDKVPSVNGLKVIKDKLFALAGPELWEIDQNKKTKVIAKGLELGGDGLEPVGKGDYLVTCWGGLVYYIYADGRVEQLQDVRGQMNTADLGFNSKENILYIPTFNNNSVVAYKLK